MGKTGLCQPVPAGSAVLAGTGTVFVCRPAVLPVNNPSGRGCKDERYNAYQRDGCLLDSRVFSN